MSANNPDSGESGSKPSAAIVAVPEQFVIEFRRREQAGTDDGAGVDAITVRLESREKGGRNKVFGIIKDCIPLFTAIATATIAYQAWQTTKQANEATQAFQKAEVARNEAFHMDQLNQQQLAEARVKEFNEFQKHIMTEQSAAAEKERLSKLADERKRFFEELTSQNDTAQRLAAIRLSEYEEREVLPATEIALGVSEPVLRSAAQGVIEQLFETRRIPESELWRFLRQALAKKNPLLRLGVAECLVNPRIARHLSQIESRAMEAAIGIHLKPKDNGKNNDSYQWLTLKNAALFLRDRGTAQTAREFLLGLAENGSCDSDVRKEVVGYLPSLVDRLPTERDRVVDRLKRLQERVSGELKVRITSAVGEISLMRR